MWCHLTELPQGRNAARASELFEWVNAFEYGDGAARQAALGLQVETGAAPRAEVGTALVRVGVSSMDIRERLGLVQSSLALLVDSLNPQDIIAIVTYRDDATSLLEPTAASDRDTAQDETSHTLRLAAAVADSAELLNGNEVVTGRGVTVEDLRVEAALASCEVAGAQDLVHLLDDVVDAEPAPTTKD